MTEPVVFYRSPRQTRNVAFLAMFMTGMAIWTIYDGVMLASFGLKLYAAFLALWAALLWYSLLFRKIFGRIEADGVVISNFFATKPIRYAEMLWSNIPDGKRAGVIAYRTDNSARDQFAAFGQRSLGPENTAALRAAIAAARPDMPSSAPDMSAKT